MPHQQRNQIDAVVAHIASTACLACEQLSQSFEGNTGQAGTVALQLAALKALLASVLCPAPHRPTFLPQALQLFNKVNSSARTLHVTPQAVTVNSHSHSQPLGALVACPLTQQRCCVVVTRDHCCLRVSIPVTLWRWPENSGGSAVGTCVCHDRSCVCSRDPDC